MQTAGSLGEELRCVPGICKNRKPCYEPLEPLCKHHAAVRSHQGQGQRHQGFGESAPRPPRSRPTLSHGSCSSTTVCTEGYLKAWLGIGRPHFGPIYSEGGGAGDPGDVLHSRWVRGLSTALPCCSLAWKPVPGSPGLGGGDRSLRRGREPRENPSLLLRQRARLWSSRERAARLPITRPWIGSPSRPSA